MKDIDSRIFISVFHSSLPIMFDPLENAQSLQGSKPASSFSSANSSGDGAGDRVFALAWMEFAKKLHPSESEDDLNETIRFEMVREFRCSRAIFVRHAMAILNAYFNVSGMSFPSNASERFTQAERNTVYRVLRDRRDVRSNFTSDAVPNDVLMRILEAANQAPSVGLMQPWEFIIIRSLEVRQRIHDLFTDANAKAAKKYEGERRRHYETLKLDAILDASINLCITCDEASVRGHGLGRQTMPETALYSTICAIQNLWLAARAENIGVGWVSVIDPTLLRKELKIPKRITVVAYLCVGQVSAFPSQPELETKGWERRRPLSETIHENFYGTKNDEPSPLPSV